MMAMKRDLSCTNEPNQRQKRIRRSSSLEKVSLPKNVMHSSLTGSYSTQSFEIKPRREQHHNQYDEGIHVLEESSFPIPETSHRGCSSSSEFFFTLAQAFAAIGHYDAACSHFEQALERCNRLDSLKTQMVVFKILHNIACCHYRLNRHAKALECFEQALSLAYQLGLDGTFLAATLNCLGVLNFHCHPKNPTQALKMLKTSLSLYQQSTGSMSKEVGTVLNNLGRVHYLMAEHDEALSVYERALRVRLQVFGEDSLDVAATKYNMGQSLFQLGRFDESMKCYDFFLKSTLSRHGPNSRDVAIVYKSMAEIHHEEGDSKLALSYFQKALFAGRAALGAHPEVASTLNKLGNLCYEMKDLDRALQYYKEGLTIERQVFAHNHPHTVITLTNIAHIHKHRGDYAAALRMYDDVRKMQVQVFGAESIKLAATLSSMGLMQYHLKHFGDAFESYQEALRVRRSHYGSDDHPDVASTLNSVGLVLFKQEMYDLAKKCFAESLRIRIKLFGPDHRDVGVLWYNIATQLFELGEDDDAIQCYKEALRVEKIALGPDHVDVSLTLQHLAQVLHTRGNLEESVKYFQEALEIERKNNGKSHKRVAKILNLIGNINLQQGKVNDMMESYVEASRIFNECPSQEDTLVIVGYNYYGLSKLNPSCAPVA